MPVSKDNTRVAVTLSNEVVRQIEELAGKEKRTISAMSAILIKEALGNRDKNKYAYLRGAEYYSGIKARNEED